MAAAVGTEASVRQQNNPAHLLISMTDVPDLKSKAK